jgi:hypothetical protein
MSGILGRVRYYIAVVLMGALFLPSLAWSAPLTPLQVQQKIVRRGTDQWIGVKLANGMALHGRVLNIGQDQFTMQPHNNPVTVDVRYADVTELHQNLSGKQAAILVACSFGVTVLITLIAHHEMSENQPKLPTQPTPVMPVVY